MNANSFKTSKLSCTKVRAGKREDCQVAGKDRSYGVKLFIGGLHPSTREEDLKNLMRPICNIFEVSLLRHKRSQQIRGFGFFKVESLKEAKLLTSMNFHLLGRIVQCQLKEREAGENTKKRVFVGALGLNVTDESLQYHFEYFGNVRSAYVVRNLISGISKGFGFVEYWETDAVQRALLYPEHNIQGTIVNVQPACKAKDLGEMNPISKNLEGNTHYSPSLKPRRVRNPGYFPYSNKAIGRSESPIEWVGFQRLEPYLDFGGAITYLSLTSKIQRRSNLLNNYSTNYRKNIQSCTWTY